MFPSFSTCINCNKVLNFIELFNDAEVVEKLNFRDLDQQVFLLFVCEAQCGTVLKLFDNGRTKERQPDVRKIGYEETFVVVTA